MARATNDDGITTDEIDTTFRVLEAVRESLSRDGMRAKASSINEAHYLVKQYDEDNHQLEELDTTDHYWVPDVGDVLYDPESNPKYGNGKVTITEVTDKTAKFWLVEQEIGKRSVAHLNPGEPNDAPVVKGKYVEGSDTEYAFPVSRLQRL